MSSVIERYRNVSGMEYWRNAQALYRDMTSYLISEKHVPTKMQEYTVKPLLGEFDELFKLIREANNVYTGNKDPDALRRRTELQNACIRKLDDIYFAMQRLIETVWLGKMNLSNTSVDAVKTRNRINDWSARLDREERLLIGWKNGDRRRKR